MKMFLLMMIFLFYSYGPQNANGLTSVAWSSFFFKSNMVIVERALNQGLGALRSGSTPWPLTEFTEPSECQPSSWKNGNDNTLTDLEQDDDHQRWTDSGPFSFWNLNPELAWTMSVFGICVTKIYCFDLMKNFISALPLPLAPVSHLL